MFDSIQDASTHLPKRYLHFRERGVHLSSLPEYHSQDGVQPCHRHLQTVRGLGCNRFSVHSHYFNFLLMKQIERSQVASLA